MKKAILLSVVVCMFTANIVSASRVIINAVGVEVSQIDGSKYGQNNTSLIDQSGLSDIYIPGVTDFDTFTTTTTACYDHSLPNYGLGGVGGLGSFYFDLGEVLDIDAIATWGQDCCSATMKTYDLYASDTFGADGSRVFIGRFSAGYSPNAYVHYFSSVQTQFLEIDVIENYGWSATRLNEVVFGGTVLETESVSIDIVPGKCPNAINAKGNGPLLVAICGSDVVDVNDIDVASIEIFGVKPVRSCYRDAAAVDPEAVEDCLCVEERRDGVTDLLLRFKKQDILKAIGPIQDGDNILLTLTGFLKDETPIEGNDCIIIDKKGKPEPDIAVAPENNKNAKRTQTIELDGTNIMN